MASVELRPNGRWRARYRQADGKQRARHFATEEEGWQFLETIVVQRHTGTYVDPAIARKWTLSDWWVEWWPVETSRLSETSAKRDESMWRNHVRPALGGNRLDQIDAHTIDSFVAELVGKGLAPASVTKAVQITARCLDGAVRASIIRGNPARGASLPTADVDDDHMVCLSAGQLRALVDVAGDSADLVSFLGWCATRFGEAAALDPDDFDLMRGEVRITKGLVWIDNQPVLHPPKTRAGKRTVPIPRHVATRLAPLLEQARESAPIEVRSVRNKRTSTVHLRPVFTSARGGPLQLNNWRRYPFAGLVKKAGLDPAMTPHDLRHTGITLWLLAGARPQEVKAWAGHKSVATVLDRYGHVVEGRADAVMAALEELAIGSDATVLQLRSAEGLRTV